MADKAIGSLVQTSTIGLSDLLVLEQNNTAKSITGQNLISQLATELDGHGGIASIAKTSSSGTNPKVDTYTITYADTTTATFTVTNGLKGDTGAQTYVWIRYANRNPIADSDMTSTPDDWIGIYSGISSSAPSHYTDYDWYEYKGDKGDTGDPAELDDAAVEYQGSASGTDIPTGAWTTTIPVVAQGNYLWTRTTLEFNSGSPVVSYSVARIGMDGTGTGTVQSVNSVTPDGSGDVELMAADIPTSSGDDVQTVLDGKQPLKLVFNNVGISSATFVADATYADYGYRAAVALTGVTATMFPEVVLSPEDAVSGNFAPVSQTYAGGVYIYAQSKPVGTTTVPTIVVWG